jgi:hypothetical protein
MSSLVGSGDFTTIWADDRPLHNVVSCNNVVGGAMSQATRADTSILNFGLDHIARMFAHYTSRGGSAVHIPSTIDPFAILGVDLGARAR